MFLQRALAHNAFTQANLFAQLFLAFRGEAGEQRQARAFILVFQHIEFGLLRSHHGAKLGEHHAAHIGQVALALQHSAEFREVGFQPVLLRVFLRGITQVSDHFVDGIFQHGHFALRAHRNGARQVALGHGGCHFGDGAHLRGEVCGELVHVLGEALPGTRSTGHFRLSAQLAFHTHFTGHGGHLIGEGGERVDHAVDRIGKLGDFAFGRHAKFLFQLTVCH